MKYTDIYCWKAMKVQARGTGIKMINCWIIFLFHINLVCAFSGDLIQSDPIIVTMLGDSVTFTCLCTKHLIVHWFKQTMGQKPILMVSSYYYTEQIFPQNNFANDFKVTNRMSVKRELDICNLIISKTLSGDSATYYCSAEISNTIQFGNGTFLILKGPGSNTKAVVQQPVSESIQTGDSVTLYCTIHTETCPGEHSVYWFRHGSGESHPGTLYTHGGRSDQCEKSPEAGSPTQSCVYNLPKRNLSLSDAGTYYCAVASCGEILFGNGTKLNIQSVPDGQNHNFLFILFCLMTTFSIMSLTVNIIVCWKMKRTLCDICTEGPDTSDCQTEYKTASVSRANEQVSDDVDLNYSTLKFTDKKKTKSMRQSDNPIYTEVEFRIEGSSS
ncbi:uncharacterized protein LOC124487050 isoform X2 [Hypomesus transpacificus]|uniref:uncharacterized protein LOC124487050 isoform X2 n=1 Tax=Hypomesus transpacificus TaxID=137520 RepID=UPI001F072900|nr:uncharacterized protein LOC124487050 isoform X2 [Hypomesus transpacificus]